MKIEDCPCYECIVKTKCNGEDCSKIDWECVSHDKTLSEEFIREYQNKVNWSCISKRQKLSKQFIKEFKRKVDWFWIVRKKSTSTQTINEIFYNRVEQ